MGQYPLDTPFEPAAVLQPTIRVRHWRDPIRLEAAIEDELVEHIKFFYPRLTVHRQWRGWPGMIPDLVAVHNFGRYTSITILELKAHTAGDTALKQLERYVTHAQRLGRWTEVFGVLAAPRLAVTRRPNWFAFWRLEIV